uniref:Uncharacterized protein n=1 Tax=Leptospirillum ferrodiazotrophum TaxID=412449 RepID=C6I103_9BACT|nr:MAG: hypothetical protein UBAL3_96120022 [Leptospirillum ferrodiazotrophum]
MRARQQNDLIFPEKSLFSSLELINGGAERRGRKYFKRFKKSECGTRTLERGFVAIGHGCVRPRKGCRGEVYVISTSEFLRGPWRRLRQSHGGVPNGRDLLRTEKGKR